MDRNTMIVLSSINHCNSHCGYYLQLAMMYTPYMGVNHGNISNHMGYGMMQGY